MRSVLIPIAFLATIAAVPFAFAEQSSNAKAKQAEVDQYPPPPVPTPTPTPIPPPTPTPTPTPTPIPPPLPTPTPLPPEINFKFIGTFGPRDRPIAVLIMGDQLLNARAGDVVFDRFILRNIGYESVDVGFVGYPPSSTRRLGITQ